MSDLPQGWIEVQISELAITQSGGTPSTSKKEYWNNGTVPWLASGGLKDSIVRKPSKYITELGLAQSSARLFPRKTVLIALTGATTGETGLLDFPCSTNQSVTGIFPSDVYIPEYLFFYLQSAKRKVLENTLGSAQPHINKKIVDETIVPLAPLNEQKRIVEKLEKLLGKVETVQARLDKTSAILKRFRQAVLAAACVGKLTASWREDKEINLETDLPFDWRIETVGNVIEDLKYGTSQKCEYEKKGVPVLRIPNIGDWFVDQSDMKFAELPEKEFNQLKLSEGDLLLIRSNGSVSLVGKTAIVRKSEENYAYAGYLIRLRPDKEQVFPQFFNYVLASYDVRLQIEIPARSTSGVNNINSTEVKALEIPLPPLEEQKEIVRRVGDLFKFADQIEARYKRARSYTDKLNQSILAKAFSGELVEQDLNDEPAFVLLDRIRHLQAEQKNKPKKTVVVKRTNMKLTKEKLEETIKNLPDDKFSFDELSGQVVSDYESLKVLFFELLDEPKPIITQVFDQKTNSIQFIREQQ